MSKPAHDPAVVRALFEQSSGAQANAKRKVGLILPGGGMNGVFTGGVMQALEKHRMTDAFDVIYSYSSGAASGLYLLSGDTAKGTSIFWDDLAGARFAKPWRMNRCMDLRYLRNVFNGTKKADIDRTVTARTVLNVYLTSIKDGKTHRFTNSDPVDPIELVVASCSFPGFAEPIAINQDLYCDGGSTEFTVLEDAFLDGCTDVLIVATVPPWYRRSRFDVAMLLARLFCSGMDERFKRKFAVFIKNYNQFLDKIFSENPMSGNVNAYVIYPDYHVSPFKTRAKTLKALEKHGLDKAEKMLTSN